MDDDHVLHCIYVLPHQVPFCIVSVRVRASVFGYSQHPEIGYGNGCFQHDRVLFVMYAIYVLVHSVYMCQCGGPSPRSRVACSLRATNAT